MNPTPPHPPTPPTPPTPPPSSQPPPDPPPDPTHGSSAGSFAPHAGVGLEEAEQILQELELVEARLRQMEEGITRTHRLATLGTMASIIAHEYNNILTPIISYCQLARTANDGDPLIRKAIDKSLAGAERAAKISASMLGFARDDDGATQSDIQTVVNESLSCMARDPAKDGIDLVFEAPEDCWVEIEPVAFQQVIINLVLNARQAMRSRGGSLKISATAMGPFTTILIADSGPGIPPEVRSTLFDPFVTRRETDPVTGSKGTGLGLAICRDLILRAGGKIDIPRSDETGTTFRLKLLTADAPTDDQLC